MAITKQTPNETADLGLVRVVPQWAQSDPRTTELVGRIRAEAPGWETKLKISDITVTGQTAVAIDVNTRLSGALVPFGLVVVGLALILLMIVFRSIAVPIKAALGYLLSIAAALGVVTAAFIWGWGAGPLGITEIGPLVSFLPIILMGVLFGLAMDYEVFLVSAIREDYVHSGHASPQERARHAIRTGFISSARVVTAAAVIMISVFAAFIPHGSSTIKPIALGLAVGVFVDAFLVRMTLVPAVLALLGSKAWWMPKRLDKALPHIDVEGSALVRHVEQVEWEETNGAVAIRAEAAEIATDDGPVAVDLSVAAADHGQLRPSRSGCTGGAGLDAGRVAQAGGRTPGGARPGAAGRGRGRPQVRTGGAAARVATTTPSTSAATSRPLLVAQSDKPWPSRRTTGRALDQAENWLSPLQAGTEGPRLADRRIGDLTTLERLLVTLSAAAVQSPELIVVAEPDRDLDPGSMSWFAGVCAELVHDTGTTVLLVGSTVTALAAAPASPVPGSETVAPVTWLGRSLAGGPTPIRPRRPGSGGSRRSSTTEAPVPADEADDGTPDRPRTTDRRTTGPDPIPPGATGTPTDRTGRSGHGRTRRRHRDQEADP